MLVASSILGCIGPLFGILATSAVYSRYEVVTWNPLALLLYVQKTQYTAGCRAATFFAGLGLFVALIMVGLQFDESQFVLSLTSFLLNRTT